LRDRFLICLPFVLAQECPYPEDWSNPHNFSNDPGDPGGQTMCGITHSEYNRYRRLHGLMRRNVKLITKDEGYEIYHENYWLPHCPALPVGLDLQFFDMAVNAGPTASVRILQYALGIPHDGVWGRITTQSVAGVTDVQAVIDKFTNRRATIYKTFRGFKEFGRDWERRTAEIGAESLKMVA
jgi:lysozyme family protein